MNVKKSIIALLFLISNSLFAQQRFTAKLEKIVVDSNLQGGLFDWSDYEQMATIAYPTVSIIKNLNTGKSDTSYGTGGDTQVLRNAGILPVGDNGFRLEHCESHFLQDTLVVQFQNLDASLPNSMMTDKILLHIINGMYYFEYKSSGNYYLLSVVDQQLTLKKLVMGKGERLMGHMEVQFLNQNQKAKIKFYKYSGLFECLIQ
jgi:hypothetical protein